MAKIDLSGLNLDELNAFIDEATRLRDQKVQEKRAELLKELQALDAMQSQKPAVARQRNASTYSHKHPKSGHMWLGRGGVPKEWQDIIPEGTAAEKKREILAQYRVEL